ncbi:MAG TPA: phosphotransferase, partial [Kiloniellaceae bacterium]|nr:phosphotransferase [Kiloniellaceae bacterium]
GRAKRGKLAADASFRSYDRLWDGRQQAVLMNAPPPQENVAAFHRVQDILLGLGFSAPRTLAIDIPRGLLLLEDFGDKTFTRALAAGAAEAPLYRMATEVLTELHKRCGVEADCLAPYDAKELEREALLLPDWYYPAVTGCALSAARRAGYLEAWRQVWPAALRVPANLVLRDYHVDNLMVLEGRSGIAACGLLDFQDALRGPISYDLASLLQDARRDVPEDLEADMISHYLAAFPDLDRAAFHTSYDVLAAQRSAKIIGIFTRLSRRDGKDDYLKHIPRVWRLLARALSRPALAPVADWFRQELPEDLRQTPRPLAGTARC